MEYLEGFDCAWPQGVIDWDRVPAKYRFAVVQCSNGTGGRDPARVLDIAGARRTKRYFLAYHYLHTDQDAEVQIMNLWGAFGDVMPARVALDFEELAKTSTPKQAVETLRSAVAQVKIHFGQAPLIYTYPNFDLQVIGRAIADAPDLSECPLWIADYGKGEGNRAPWIVPPWKTWAMCQTSGNGSTFIEGIGGHVDHDVFNGDEAAFREFLGLPPAGIVIDDGLAPPAPPDFEPRKYDDGPT